MWNLTFSRALILFTVTMTPVFLAFLMLSERITKQREKPTHSTALTIIGVGLICIEVLTISLSHMPSFETTLTRFILILLIASFLLYAFQTMSSSNKIQVLTLLSAVMYHIILLYSPPFDVRISERTPAMAKLILEGHWDPNWHLLHSTYDPFPMDLGLFGTVSMVTSIPHISQLNNWAIYLPFIIAHDLVLYSLTKRVTDSRVAGVIAIFILASTPPANIISHGTKWIGNMFVLISALALIKAFDGPSSISNITVANLSYGAAILFHPSSVIGVFLPLGVVVVSYLANQAVKRKVWTKLFRSRLFRTTFILFTVITLTRGLYTAGYLEDVLPALKNFALTAFGYSTPIESYTPVYEQAVSPVNAYAWSTPVAMASALVIYSLLKRRAAGGAFTLVMSFVGGVFASLGLLVAVAKSGGFQGAMYPAFTLLIPAATVVGERVLRSSRTIAIAIMVLMVLSVGVAVTDPMMSPQRYRETGAGDVPPKMEDLLEARFMADVIPSDDVTEAPVGTLLVAPYEITASFLYLSVAEGRTPYRYYTGSADLNRIVINSVVHDKALLPSRVMYIWPQRWLPDIKSHLTDVPINVFYDSDRYVIFRRAPYP